VDYYFRATLCSLYNCQQSSIL